MGLLFDFKTFTMKTYLIGAALLIVFYGSRELSLKILPLLSKSISMADRLIGKVTIPRGLATAVMALMVHEAKIPGTESLVPLAFLSILGTGLCNGFASSSDRS